MDKEELALGIDIGTSFSCIAVFRNNKVEIIPNEIGENITPSVVSFNDKEVLVGEKAINKLITDPKNTIYSIKRLIGRDYNDKEVKEGIESKFWTYDIVEDEKSKRPKIKVKLNKKESYYFPEDITKFIIEKVYQSATNYLGKPVNNAVITIPAYFNDNQRSATKKAAEKVGLKVLQIINEPTAASLAYGLHKKLKETKKEKDDNSYIDNGNNDKRMEIENNIEEKLIIVFDLGGGTFDVTLLGIEEPNFKVISTSGNTHLGGDDFDKRIIDYCLDILKTKYNYDLKAIKEDKNAMNRLKIASEKAKINLSFEETTNTLIKDIPKLD